MNDVEIFHPGNRVIFKNADIGIVGTVQSVSGSSVVVLWDSGEMGTYDAAALRRVQD